MKQWSLRSAWHVTVLLTLLLAGFLAPVPRTRAASVIYVNAGANGANDGSSWANAYTSLQVALSAAISGSELWVATGTYRPAGPGGDRSASFALKNGVALYGGFTGTETQRDQRDWAGNPTILSGDLNGNDGPNFANNAENSYHVIYSIEADSTAILDGFTISAGNADSDQRCRCGGGMYNGGSSTTLANLVFSANAAQVGGGMYNLVGNPTLTNVTLSGNSAQVGGGMYNSSSAPALTNITFHGNAAQVNGGGMYNSNSSPTLTNVTFSGNSAQLGGGIHNNDSHPTVQNSILWGNTAPLLSQIANTGGNYADVRTSIVQGGYPGGSGILDADPLFVAPVPAGSAPTTTGDLHLRPGSPAIDAGDTTLLPAGVTTDRDGMPRVVGPRVDLGAFEAHAQLSLSKTVDRPSAGPAERIIYRLVLDNTGAYSSTVTLSDTLPSGLTYAGPVTVEPAGATVGPPPTLVRDLVLRPGQTVIVNLPVDVDVGQPAGTVISNTASLSGTNAANTSTSTATITVTADVHGASTLYLPLIVHGVDE